MALCAYADVALPATNRPAVEKTEKKTQYVSIVPDTATEKTLCGGKFHTLRIIEGARNIARRGGGGGGGGYSSQFEV